MSFPVASSLTRQKGIRLKPIATTGVLPARLDPTASGEVRIRDTDLGERLGMAQPLNIRSTIERYRGVLSDFGTIHAAREMVRIGSGAYRDTTVYYLNEEQALYLCALSRAEKAHFVRVALIRAFTAWRRAELVPAGKPTLPAFPDPVAVARAWADAEEAKQAARAAFDAAEAELISPSRGLPSMTDIRSPPAERPRSS
jgi:hypothetical protein